MSETTDRRGFLNKTLLGAAGAGALASFEERILMAAVGDETAATEPPPPDPGSLPCGRIGDLTISRMFMGGNLIGGWAHSRDLLYVSHLLKAYNTEAKIFETLALGEEQGINTILIDPVSQDTVERYKREQGGKIQTMVCMRPDTNQVAMRDEVRRLVDKGATTLYTHGHFTDTRTMAGDVDTLAKAIELIQAEGIPAGIGSHSLETPMAAEKAGLKNDYYVKTFHSDRYWSATPAEKREEWCWYKPQSNEHGEYHDNMFCLDAERTAAFMEKVEKPWVAFKVLAAGAIQPRFGFSFAFRGGADFITVGMFDFQIAANVQLAKDLLRKIDNRNRPWRA